MYLMSKFKTSNWHLIFQTLRNYNLNHASSKNKEIPIYNLCSTICGITRTYLDITQPYINDLFYSRRIVTTYHQNMYQSHAQFYKNPTRIIFF